MTDQIMDEKIEILEKLLELDTEEQNIWGAIFVLEMLAYSRNLRGFIVQIYAVAERLAVYTLGIVGVGITKTETGSKLGDTWILDHAYILNHLNNACRERYKNEKKGYKDKKKIGGFKGRRLSRDFSHALIEALSKYEEYIKEYDLVRINEITLILDPLLELRNARIGHGGLPIDRTKFKKQFGEFLFHVKLIQEWASIVTKMDYREYSTFDIKAGIESILQNSDKVPVSIRMYANPE